MNISRTGISIATAMLLAACSSPPKPAVPDGSSRVAANDPIRVQALQDRVSLDRSLLTENNLLKAQVEVLSSKLNEMVTIVREALLLPPAVPPKALSPLPSILPQVAPASPTAPRNAQPLSLGDMPKHSFASTPNNVVIRVFHPWAKTDFEPSAQVADALINVTRSARAVEVRGMTDSAAVNPMDRIIAMERAEKARNWLIKNGTDPSKIRTKYFSAGNFLVENKTDQGRSLNRRVEVDVKTSEAAS